MLTFVTSHKNTHNVCNAFPLIIALLLCISILTITAGIYASPCRLRPPQSPCKFGQGRFLKTLEASLDVARNVEQPCDDVLMIEADDVSSDIGVQAQNDIRHYTDIRIQPPPIYLRNLSFHS